MLDFAATITMHVRARDFGRNLFVNAIGMTVICVLSPVVSFRA